MFRSDELFRTIAIMSTIMIIMGSYVTDIKSNQNSKNEPNIVLIVVDALRRDHLGIYGYQKETMPFLTEKSKAGLIYTNYYSNASETVTSHAALFSGNLSDPYESKISYSFVQKLQEAGYRTYGISANPLVNKLYNFNLGFDMFESDPPSENMNEEFLLSRMHNIEKISGIKNPLTYYMKVHLSTTADLINPRIFKYLEKHISEQKNAPFFLFVNYFEPHDPYFPHQEAKIQGNYNLRDENDSLRTILCDQSKMSPQKESELIQLYDGEIRFVDSAISDLYEWIKKRKMLENTIFIITSDHGEMLGEKKLWTHSMALYASELEIPMIIFGRNIKKGIIQYLDSHINTGALILSLVFGSNKKFHKDNRNNKIIIQHHRTLEGQDSWRKCLPEMGRVELFRFTGLEMSTYYYQFNGKENVEVYDNKDKALINNKYVALPENIKIKIISEIRNAVSKLMNPKSQLNKKIEFQLRTLGYIR